MGVHRSSGRRRRACIGCLQNYPTNVNSCPRTWPGSQRCSCRCTARRTACPPTIQEAPNKCSAKFLNGVILPNQRRWLYQNKPNNQTHPKASMASKANIVRQPNNQGLVWWEQAKAA
jgi:hypothetical protein